MLDFGGTLMVLTFKTDIYPRSAVLKSAFAFTERAYIHLDESEGYYIVSIIPKQGEGQIPDGEFMNEMLFQTLRLEIANKTRAIRELTLARAFASTVIGDTIKSEPTGSSELYNEEILSNWFSNEQVDAE